MESGLFSTSSSGPSGRGKSHTTFGTPEQNPNPNTPPLEKRSPAATQQTPPPPLTGPQRTALSSSGWGNQRVQLPTHVYPTNHQWLSPVVSSRTSHATELKLASEPINIHVPKRGRSPPFLSPDDNFLKDLSSTVTNVGRLGPLGTRLESRLENGNSEPLKRMKSLSLVYESSRPVQNHGLSYGEGQRLSISPSRSGSQRVFPLKDVNIPSHQSSFALQSHADIHHSGTVSPPKPAYFNNPKRARSPPLPTFDGSFGTSSLDFEREMEAKAKRLARFNTKVSRPILDVHDHTVNKLSGNGHTGALVNNVNAIDYTVETHGSGSGGILSDHERLESSAIVVGVCPDMCPESERDERERIGDLDKYERVDGDRNQTSKLIAVKKYNRTAERDADLIRPMPVLQKTMDYLLQLLNQPYSSNFLGIYNFLWDRMRAIRMDLRMQHIFNEEAITMLEQMIRLHIIAMHELCEYKKGEGFSEGFDAHLNIEQMNKTSVELFQIYDDHRTNGRSALTEKEFRGYYALLKLDRHPGYKVEPAELSLDLAKMTPEIRCSPEILFARDVARVCRMGNYISFFRLARKATYIQACLMHAHFAKIRTQALVSLHSGIQNNQGIPVEHVVDWLAMEGEDIGSLLEYHGFSLKKYEEMYMVKEGPFLSSDIDFPTKCSRLVHLKKSRSIFDDVYSAHVLTCVSEERETAPGILNLTDKSAVISRKDAWPNAINEEMLEGEVETVPFPLTVVKSQQLVEEPIPTILENRSEGDLQELSLARAIPSLDGVASNLALQGEEDHVTEIDEDAPMDETLSLKLSSTFQPGRPTRSNSNCIENLELQRDAGKSVQNEICMITPHQKKEANIEKHIQILRKWKQQSLKLRRIREWRLSLANEALSSLSLGPPLRQTGSLLRHSADKLNIDFITMERFIKQQKSWARLNVSELVAPILSSRNPGAKCICWKLIICVNKNETHRKEYLLAVRWLLSKLLGGSRENDDDLLVSSSGISIWKKWIDTESSPFQCCCLSIIREFDVNQAIPKEDTVAGLSCVMFLVSESVPWEIQRVQLHNFLKSIPSGSSLPLLIVSSDIHKEESTDPSFAIINSLGLHVVDNSKIKSSSVVFLMGGNQLEASNVLFDDDQLTKGLIWLANYSPLQPVLCLVKTRELVSHYLSRSLDVLDNLRVSDVVPPCCISAFNEALDRLADEILAAASTNPNNWPSPEIDLLMKSSCERMAASMFLPTVGWNSPIKIEPVLRAIEGCKLPSFSNDISWLNQGCLMGSQIQNQKSALQECLLRYLTESCQFNRDLASREASVMLQKGAGLELTDSCYHIVPRWVMVFRRIFNWQLMKLTSGDCSIAYVLDQKDEPCTENSVGLDVVRTFKSDSVMMDLETHFGPIDQPSVSSIVPEVSFDEMVEVSCSVPSVKRHLPACSPICLPPAALRGSGHVSENDLGGRSHDCQTNISDYVLGTDIASHDPDVEDLRCNNVSGDVFINKENNEERLGRTNSKDDRLSMLLVQCKSLQDMIDEKLAIYF